MKKYLAIILGVAFLHRFIFSGARQLWTDELLQARIIKFASPAEILSRLRGGMDLASPLDFFVQKGVTVLLGDSTWAMRLHAVLFGTLSIWIFYRLARFLYGDRVALYSATLFAFFPLAYRYSLEARPYALLMFLTLLSYDLLFRQLAGRDRSWRGWLLIGGVSTLLLYTSFLGGLILMSQFVGLAMSALWKPHLDATRTSDGMAQESVESTPVHLSQVMAYSLTSLAALGLFYPWMRFEWAKPSLSPASEIADPQLILTFIKGLGDNSYPVACLLIFGVIAGICALLRNGRRTSLVWLLTWFLIPIPALLVIEVWAGYFFVIRHVLHATPPLILIAGYGLSYTGERLNILPKLPRRPSNAAVIFAALLILMSVWIGQVRARSEPADWRGAAAFLQETIRSGDTLAMPEVFPLLEYYSPGLAAYRTADLDPGPGFLATSGIHRRVVLCYDMVWPDPCGTFRASALADMAWSRHQLKGFTVFIQGK
jgi:mannosyltransferase